MLEATFSFVIASNVMWVMHTCNKFLLLVNLGSKEVILKKSA